MTDSEDLLKQIAEHDAVIEKGAGEDLYDQQVLAYALLSRAQCFKQLGRIDEAPGDWTTLRQQFGESSDGDLLSYVAAGCVAKGAMLQAAERFDEALVAYDEADALSSGVPVAAVAGTGVGYVTTRLVTRARKRVSADVRPGPRA